jgi:hypothetical protein
MNKGPGPGVTVAKVQSLNTVKRSESVADPAKGINNNESINKNQTSKQVQPDYLDNKDDFNRESVSTGQLWERTKEEYDEEVATEIDEAMEVVMRAFNLPNGVLNVRRSKKYIEVLKALHEGTGQIIKIIAEPVISTVPNVIPSVPNVPSHVTGDSIIRVGSMSNGITMQIERPCDYCQQYTYLEKRGKRCTMCEQKRDYDYCMSECGFCEMNRKAYNNANSRVTTSQYVQIIKQERVEEMLSRQAPMVGAEEQRQIQTNKDAHKSVVQSNATMFNRIGNFVDKFLAVTYTVDVADMTSDNIGYLVRQLEENFMKLTQIKDMPCKGYVYVIEYTKALVPHLHGLVRMSAERIGKRIAASDTRFTGKNKIITPQQEKAIKRPGDKGIRDEKLKMLLKPINVEGWISYMKKMYVITGKTEFKGYMERIIEGWEYKEVEPMCPF